MLLPRLPFCYFRTCYVPSLTLSCGLNNQPQLLTQCPGSNHNAPAHPMPCSRPQEVIPTNETIYFLPTCPISLALSLPFPCQANIIHSPRLFSSHCSPLWERFSCQANIIGVHTRFTPRQERTSFPCQTNIEEPRLSHQPEPPEQGESVRATKHAELFRTGDLLLTLQHYLQSVVNRRS